MKFRSLIYPYLVFLGILFGLSFSKGNAESNSDSGSSFIGVCSQITRESKFYNPFSIHQELMDSINAININFTRAGFQWSAIHPTHAEWDWRVTDAVVASAKKNDINILALITGMPKELMKSPENAIELWIEFVDSLTVRYKEDIFHWEIWNEPNLRSGNYWPQDKLPDLFATYTREAATIIRRNQPNATILLGGLSTGRKANPFGLWKSLFDLGVLDLVDGIAYHTYNYPGVELIDFNRQISELVSKYTSEKKEYWITEYGVPAIDSYEFPKFSYDAQSKSIMQSILVHWATGGTRFFIFDLWDKQEFSTNFSKEELKQNRNRFFGLMEKDKTPKPSYAAVRWLSLLLNEYEPLELQNRKDGVLIIVRNKKNGKRAYFSWGPKVQQELIENKSDKKMSFFETSEAQFNLDQVKSRTINMRSDDVLFWR